MKHHYRNYLKRLNFNSFEKQNLILKIIINNKILNLKQRTHYAKIRHGYGKNSSLTLIRNNCNHTARNRGVLSHYALSRLKFKTMAATGLIPGASKAS
jgi:ribosomal protein S14